MNSQINEPLVQLPMTSPISSGGSNKATKRAKSPNSGSGHVIGRGVSIEQYDPYNPKEITEKASLVAMRNLCILKSELKMPTNNELRAYDDAEVRSIVRTHHEHRIQKLLNAIMVERQRILSSKDGPAYEATVKEIKPKMGAVEMEKAQLEKMKRRQQREVEQMIATLVQLKVAQSEALERDRKDNERIQKMEAERKRRNQQARDRHMKRIKVLEREEEKRRKEDAEARKQQHEKEMEQARKQQADMERKRKETKALEREKQRRAERNRKHIQQIEEQRKQKLIKQQRDAEARETRRLEIMRTEQEKQKLERDRQHAKRQHQIAAAKEHEREMLEKKRSDSEQRERERERQQKVFEEKQKDERKKYREAQERKTRRNMRARNRIEEEDMKKRKALMTTDAQITERLRKRDEMNKKRATSARLSRSDSARRLTARHEQWKAKEEKLFLEMKRNEEAKEQHIQKIIAERAHERKITSIRRQLRDEERVEAAQRLERQRQLKLERQREKLDESMARIDYLQQEREQLHKERRDIIAKLSREKEKMSHTFKETLGNKPTDEKSIRKLAKTYGLDLSQIEARVNTRRSLSAHTLPVEPEPDPIMPQEQTPTEPVNIARPKTQPM